MQEAVRSALRATEDEDDEIMTIRAMERMLLEGAIRLRRGRQELVAARDRKLRRRRGDRERRNRPER
jgi:hypothetical protein